MTWIILYMLCQIIQMPIKKGVIAKVWECQSTFIVLSTLKLDLDLSTNSGYTESLALKIISEKTRSTLKKCFIQTT